MPPDSECLFCRIVAGDLPARIVDEDERTISFLDIAPATRGHTLVIPRAHAGDIHEIEDGALAAVHVAAKRLADTLGDRLGADGVTIMQSNGRAAWQTVFHLHVHVIPRYAGDPLRLPWTPRAADDAELDSVAQALSRRFG